MKQNVGVAPLKVGSGGSNVGYGEGVICCNNHFTGVISNGFTGG
jgi:hypothetical protein